MSKGIKSIASIALPVIGTLVAPGIGTALGSTLGAATTAAIGGAVGGGLGGAISGGGVKGALKGAALGGAGGYLAGGGLTNILGTPAGVPLQGPVQAGAAPLGVSQGTGILGQLGSVGRTISDLTGVGTGAVASSGGNILGKLTSSPLSLLSAGSAVYNANAANQIAKEQARANQAAIDAQNQALSQVRGDLQSFREAGASTVGGLTSLVNDPNAQKDFITSNPFYQSLAKDATDRIYANQAARGKLASGSTAQALQNSLLLLGNDLLNQNITQKQNVANM
ncbi:MAG: hypothetical protein CV087_08810, partial [Candidatus Brocadia sp. WS118]